jgi:hypothetical protein
LHAASMRMHTSRRLSEDSYLLYQALPQSHIIIHQNLLYAKLELSGGQAPILCACMQQQVTSCLCKQLPK